MGMILTRFGGDCQHICVKWQDAAQIVRRPSTTGRSKREAARFPGQWFQTENGLHQNWMRDYDSTTGRYSQADPLGLVDGASVYGYALQNPGRYVDPRGEEVSLVCRPLAGSLGGLLAGLHNTARHCAVFVADTECDCLEEDGDGAVAQFSLSSPDSQFSTNNSTYNLDRQAYRSSARCANPRQRNCGSARYVIPVPQGMSSCNFDKAVIAEGRRYRQGPYSNMPGGENSNTAAFNTVRQAAGDSRLGFELI
jgi:RHS repeat-associated protein